MAKLIVHARFLPDGFPFAVTGRVAWALAELVKAGSNGCTPIDNPGPRWSAYVFTLKQDYFLDIETVNEPHSGQFPGTHARYVLLSPVEIVGSSEQSERRAA